MTVMNPQKKNKTVTATKGPVVPPGEFVWPSLARDCFLLRSPDDAASPPMRLSPYISDGASPSFTEGKKENPQIPINSARNGKSATSRLPWHNPG
jgi:hypothetical protein